jgi:membrane associated rhomboid family serine protease
VRYLALYLVSAIGGSVLVYVLDPLDTDRYGLGASGAIFGLFSAFYLVARRLRLDATSILVTIGINLVLTLLIPNISLWAHVGGLITGALIGLVYTTLPSRPSWWQAIQVGIVVAAGLVLFAVGVVGVGG